MKIGTGFLISPNLVLTCAHNLFDKVNKKIFTNFKFYPGIHGQSSKHYEVEGIYFDPQYHQKKKIFHEYGLLKLTEKVPEK